MGVTRVSLAGMAAIALAAGVAAAPAAANCTQPSSELSQSIDGRISGCVRIGPVAAGPHTIVVQQILDAGPPSRLPPGKPPPGLRRPPTPSPPPAEPAVAVSLRPASGRPGTVVTVTGRLRRPFGGRRFAYPDLCWAGCAHGLSYSGVSVHWISPRAFRARVVVPAAPWVMNGTFRVAPLASGPYAIAVQCLRSAKGCSASTEGAATFTLRAARQPAWCRTQASCASLKVTPAHALPGEVVRISGRAPLTSLIGSRQPFVDQTETLRGHPRRPAVRFSTAHGLDQVTFGQAPLRVIAPPRYATLRDVVPLGTVSDGVAPIAAAPASPSRVAWCQGASIALTDGATTTMVSTAAVGPVLAHMGFAINRSQPPACAAVAPIDSAAGVPVGLAAAFSVALPAGMPPVYDAAVVTYDGGRSWAPVPVPPGSIAAAFGGFRYRGASVEAVFARRRPGQATYPSLDPIRARAELTSPDGLSWSAGPEGCPAAGPCVTLTPFAPGNCAMNGSEQPVVRSADGGRRWSALAFPPWVQACAQATLVALSARSELLVDSTSTFPVLRTTDGGTTWHDVALPARGGHGNLTVLPDGSLVMSPGVAYTGRWKLLRRGARAWCALRTPSAAVQRRLQLSAPAVIDGALWWLSGPANNPAAVPAVSQLPLSSLSC